MTGRLRLPTVLFETYKKIRGNLRISGEFVVPSDSLWPTEFHNYKLGKDVRAVRLNLSKDKGVKYNQDDLKAVLDLGFITNYQNEKEERLLLAVQTYKALFGNVNVPQRFVIPKTPSDEWPESLRGLKLSSILNDIKTQHTYKNIHNSLREIGVDIGQQANFDHVFMALKSYQKIHGILEIPSKFVIPKIDSRYPAFIWGMKLGRIVDDFKKNDSLTPQQKEKLLNLGLNLDKQPETVSKAKSDKFNVIYSALEAYKSVHGDVDVPARFAVPVGDVNFPKDTWGLKLGKTVTSIRTTNQYKEFRTQLTTLGLKYDLQRVTVASLTSEQILKAIQQFTTLHNHTNIPVNFDIEKNDVSFDENLRGVKLGSIVNKILTRENVENWNENSIYCDNTQALLQNMGVTSTQSILRTKTTRKMKIKTPINTKKIIKSRSKIIFQDHIKIKESFKRVYSALKTYKQLHGDVLVVRDFVVPNNKEYPKKTWGLKLGIAINNVRHKNSLAKYKVHFANLGVEFKKKSEFGIRFGRIYSALSSYKQLHGNLIIPRDFVVPRDDVNYARSSWNLTLGNTMNHIRFDGAYPKYRDKLTTLGVNFDSTSKQDKFNVIYSALETYKVVHGNMSVPQKFVVPRDVPYPENIWGLKLGENLSNIRHKGAYSEYKDQLVSLGVDFTVKLSLFDTILSALEAYKSIHGNLSVPVKFIVPSDDSAYPDNAWGMRLGVQLSSIRSKGAYSEHRDRLTALGVNFDGKQSSLFDNVYAALVAYKSVYGIVKVPLKFVVPQDDVSFPVKTWGMKLGTIVKGIRFDDKYISHRADLEQLGFVFKTKLPAEV